MMNLIAPGGSCKSADGQPRRATVLTPGGDGDGCGQPAPGPARADARLGLERDRDTTSGRRVPTALRLDGKRAGAAGACACSCPCCRKPHGATPAAGPTPPKAGPSIAPPSPAGPVAPTSGSPAPRPGGIAPTEGGRPDAAAASGDMRTDIREAIAAIQADPVIAAAFARWGSLSVEEKLAIARRISAHLGEAFGFAPNGNLGFDPGLDAEGTLGLWTPDGISLSAAALADPVQFLDTVVHEQIHEYDHQNTAVELADADHNSGAVLDDVYRIGHAVSGGVFAAA